MKIKNKTSSIVHIALMTALTIGLSFVRIPFYPVSFSLMTLAAMLAGIILPRWQAVASQVLYVVIGLIGLPIFTQGGGLGYIFNPTFGYILFLPFLTLLVSLLYKKIKIAGIILPAILLLIIGTSYYVVLFRLPFNKNLLTIFWSFAIIFIPTEILKAVCAYFFGIKLKRIINNDLFR